MPVSVASAVFVLRPVFVFQPVFLGDKQNTGGKTAGVTGGTGRR
jgi:hypothetical protein